MKTEEQKTENPPNIHGYCPHCNANLDGDLVIDTFVKQGKTEEEAKTIAAMYDGYDEHGEANRWGRQIGIYSTEFDRTTDWRCPDCKKEWGRSWPTQ